MLATLLHFLVGLLGLALLYSALFLHENEEGQLQNRLERLWIDIDDLSKVALSKQAAFLQRVSAMANSSLDRLFGARLFSAAAVSASLCFSLGSFMLLYIAQSHFVSRKVAEEPYAYAAAIISILIGLLPAPWRYLGFLWIIAILYALTQSIAWSRSPTEVTLRFSAVFLGGFSTDLLFIALSRWCLRKSSQLKKGWTIVSFLALNGCVGLLLLLPVLLDTRFAMQGKHVRASAFKPLVYLSATNGVSGAISLLFVALALAALAHLLVWPLLERPLYSLQRFGVARNPKLLAAASGTCLLFAWPRSPLILGITKLLHLG